MNRLTTTEEGAIVTTDDAAPTSSVARAALIRAGEGAQRSYVRLAVLGDRGCRRAHRADAWPLDVAAELARRHDVSLCDASEAGASAYDVRRAQLRVAVSHRPRVVALDVGAAELRQRDWDVAEFRSHLMHCARVLTTGGAVVLSTGVGSREWRHRERAARMDAVHEELAATYGVIHLDRDRGGAELAERFMAALAEPGSGASLSARRRV